MIDFFYQMLARIGYTHPVHPVLSHVALGMVIGAFIFALLASIFHRPTLALTAHHCMILPLVILPPTALLGYMDWQHFYAGAWLFPIKMKLTLAPILFTLLLVAVILKLTTERETVKVRILLVYTLSFITVLALGYFGGELVYGQRSEGVPSAAPDIQAGEKLFTTTCSPCHPNGGNLYKANLPLAKAPQLADFNTFLPYIRSPQARDGSKTLMPPMTPERLSDEQAKEVYHYIVQVLKKD